LFQRKVQSTCVDSTEEFSARPRALTQRRLAVNPSVSENSAGNPSEFGKELPLATKHSVFSIAESREGLRPAHRNLAFHLHYLSASVVLKNADISTTKAAVELALSRGWRRLLFAVFGGGSMKVMRSAFLGLGLLFAVSAAQAQEPRVKANIPFDFVVGDRVLPAGEYVVSQFGQSNAAISILKEDRKAEVLILTSACTSSGPSKSGKLVFHAIGGRYFLSQVWTEGYDQGRQLRTSKAEIELAKNGTTSKDLVLAANRSH